MTFKAEQECPQCGASLEMDEEDHLLACPYCNTTSFLTAPDYFRFVLPPKHKDGDMVYIPYLRFRGGVYSCLETTIKYRIADITHLAIPFTSLPPSLGLRPQALKMRFLSTDTPGIFLKNTLNIEKALQTIPTYTADNETIFHEAHIGETVSIIYLPLVIKDGIIHDAITDDVLAKIPAGKDIFSKVRDDIKHWRLTSLATLCPQCGWNMQGASGSVALSCDNCQTVWEASKQGFRQLSHENYKPTQPGNLLFMPFWKMTAQSKGVEIRSYADFIRVTNQPRVPLPAWEETAMQFWCPAFKIRPKIFLQLASQLTGSQKNFRPDPSPDRKISRYPVTLPKSEAVQSLKVILANSATSKKKIVPLLPDTNFLITEIKLAYVPFIDQGYNLFQSDSRANINKKVLHWAQNL